MRNPGNVATKRYEIIDGLVSSARVAVVAVLEPDLNYPEQGLIIVGSLKSRDRYEPNIAQFSGSPDAIEKLANTLLQAVADVRAVRP